MTKVLVRTMVITMKEVILHNGPDLKDEPVPPPTAKLIEEDITKRMVDDRLKRVIVNLDVRDSTGEI